ncbi:nucleotide-binding protein [Bradyrhizobium japonicum]|jgi:hypothetical protein|uniref:CobQ/CobB/MinD/ParA nucleotide binding domain-containing protein n=1 Tax=Bradyrhizobium japonicum TaxID=375 RepID=A0ABV2RV13_BRAJP|nr:hypothetical protein [Bradyrhizobium japonicum]MCP1761719.1 hypothetical protein [Bradyrhizobium japonicum]MCP1793299.1 hypothetical protein [Bradyrhizobium japonicum]MCP1805732.1 hypothetical protein [Bradyrhizobium japonicum]MCP1814749.1 hypothetical protein [Bradyrhizobium japonicum]MCP1873822.1 hypothetical protein [Bradyrhizobium japonicum]
MTNTIPLKPPFLAITAAKKGGVGKTHLMATIADLLALNGYPFTAFQADDKRRLSTLIGTKVVDLRPNPDLVMHDPALVRRSFTPLYTAASKAVSTGQSVLFDIGADEVENAANFLKDVDLDEDLATWKLPALVFILVQAETDAIASAAETIRRFREAMPSGRIVLVENLLDRGSLESLRNSGPARQQLEKDLKPVLAGVERIAMPAILSDFWEPYENAGLRFLKALAMDPQDAAKRLGMEVGDIKIARRAIAVYFREMHRALACLIDLPKGGAS